MQIIFAALVLVYSLLIGTENFSRRSEKLHRCGLELGRLARELKPYKEGEVLAEGYEGLQNRYYDILEKYENHVGVDFLFTKLDMHETYYPKCGQRVIGFVVAWLRYITVFSGHFVVMSFVVVWVTLMLLR